MRRLTKLLSELSIATLFALAVGGLIVPASLFAQPRLSAVDDLFASGRIQIDILELDERGFPSVVRAQSDGRKLRFELSEEAFSWTDEDNPKNVGSGQLPSLDDVATWKIELLPEGGFRAALPYAHFRHAEIEGLPGRLPLDKLAEPTLVPEAEVETLGAFDPVGKSFELSALLPDGEIVDISVSLAALPADAELGSLAIGELSAKGWIFVAISIVLRILAIIFITCVGLIASCGFVCNYTCPWGVLAWNAQCGTNAGCNCNCAPPPPPPDPPGCGGVVVQGDALKLGGGGSLALPASAFTLTRLEASEVVHHGQPVSFLMAEWAVVGYDVGLKSGISGLEVLRSSSEDYARSQLDAVAGALSSQAKSLPSGRHAVLLVARPDHDANSREIPLPQVRLAKNGVGASLGEGSILVRADFADDRGLQGFEVLHETVGGLSSKTVEALAEAIALDYALDKQHRTVVFADLQVHDGELQLNDTLIYLPKCCCGEVFCI